MVISSTLAPQATVICAGSSEPAGCSGRRCRRGRGCVSRAFWMAVLVVGGQQRGDGRQGLGAVVAHLAGGPEAAGAGHVAVDAGARRSRRGWPGPCRAGPGPAGTSPGRSGSRDGRLNSLEDQVLSGLVSLRGQSSQRAMSGASTVPVGRQVAAQERLHRVRRCMFGRGAQPGR